MEMKFMSFAVLLLVFSVAMGLPAQPKPAAVDNKSEAKVDLSSAQTKISPETFREVKEHEIPENSLVYVLEEPIDNKEDGEVMETAHNIVFRPLFRYRAKQQAAQRRNYNNRIRRRYFVPSRYC